MSLLLAEKGNMDVDVIGDTILVRPDEQIDSKPAF
jgi:hypothetical protein